MLAQSAIEQIDGYAEWRQRNILIVDGQRVGATAATRFRGSSDAPQGRCDRGDAGSVERTSSLLVKELPAPKP